MAKESKKNDKVTKRYTKKNTKVNMKEEREKESVKVIFIRIGIIALVGILLLMSTYAWFTTQKDITISNFRGTVEVVEFMEISLDAQTWHQEIDLSELVDGKTQLQAAVDSRNSVYGGALATAPNIEPRELLPVSTVGGVGSSIMPLYQGQARSKKLTSLADIEQCKEIDASNKGVDDGYFAFDIYIRNSGRDDNPDTLQLNLNSSAQVLKEAIEKEVINDDGSTTIRKYEGQAYSGIQNTLRVALALYEDTTKVLASQKEILDATKGSKVEKVTIWEPNAPYHVQSIVDNNNKLTGSGAVNFENGDALTTYALKSSAVGATIDDVYNTDDARLGAQATLQTEMTNTTEGSEDYRILSTDGKPLNLVDTTGADFTIKSNAVSRLRVYVWMEGQDVDCINLASFGGGVEIDLGLTKDDAVGEVLTRTDDDNE